MQFQSVQETRSNLFLKNRKTEGLVKTVTLDFLRSVKIFEGLTNDELSEIKRCCEEIQLPGNTVVFEEKDTADYLYALVEGEISIRYKLPFEETSKEQSVASIKPGGTFGWSSLRPSARYTLSAHSVGEGCTAIRIKRDNLVELLERNHTIGYKVMKNLTSVIGERFMALQNEIARRDGQDLIHGW